MMGAKRRRRRGSHLGALPLTSMIDVVFLLLVYFLVTSSFKEPERDLSSSVQGEGGGVSASELQPQIVDVVRTADGVEYRIGSRVARSREELRAVLAALPRDAGVAIRARRDAPIGAIATAMQVAQDEGYVKRSYVPRDE